MCGTKPVSESLHVRFRGAANIIYKPLQPVVARVFIGLLKLNDNAPQVRWNV